MPAVGLGKCEACQEREAVYHFTVRFSIFGPTGEKIKLVQFALCADCEKATQQVLCRDEMMRRRVALRFVHEPEFYSQDWRGRIFQRSPAR